MSKNRTIKDIEKSVMDDWARAMADGSKFGDTPIPNKQTQAVDHDNIEEILDSMAIDETEDDIWDEWARSLIDDNGEAFMGKTVEEFENYLVNRDSEPDCVYGMFSKDAAVVNFFDDKHGENILTDIRKRNEEQGMGNIRIPATDIELINYSYCPKCEEIHSFDDLVRYYKHPPKLPNVDRRTQVRKDTRVACKVCGAFFIPSLIISDGTPKHETQLLCRTQVADSIEEFYLEKNRHVLTRKKSNVVLLDGKKRIKNDVKIEDISVQQTLVSNFIQYMSPDCMISFIEGKNVERGDLLF